MNQQIGFRRLVLYFGMFATVVAGMLGLGQHSWNLPILVGTCALVSFIYTDWLGWFSLHRWLVYLGMILGAFVPISELMGDRSANHMLAVGNLLVLVQLPLMFQKKSKRVFEQWGVFLLLELVVAALINDNVLYGILMMPVLAIGCAAMMALAQFASQLRHSESISESQSAWAKLLHWLGKEQNVSRRSSGVTLSTIPGENVYPLRYAPSKWLRSVLPMSFSVFVFAIAYFYCLPRLNSSFYEPEEGAGAGQVGFSESVSLRQTGEILQNDTPVFRMSLTDKKTKKNYRPAQPPYIRVSVSHRYMEGPSKGIWDRSEPTFGVEYNGLRTLPMTPELEPELVSSADLVTLSFIEKSSLGPVVPSIPPFASDSLFRDFRMVLKDWRIIEMGEMSHLTKRKRRYSYDTLAFSKGFESAIVPDFRDCMIRSTAKESAPSGAYASELTHFPSTLSAIIPFRNKVLSESPVGDSDLAKAIALEDYLASSPEFSYTLSLTGPVNRDLDPIVDFLLYKRKGHCQYFASSLALLLRSLNIQTRIVVGFRPSEYNELGQYFLVQQNHAHVWVEAYFPVSELKKRFPDLPSWVSKGAWLRLDPTPSGNGSNAGGTLRRSSGETLDVMQDLWTEMVLSLNKTNQNSMISMFGETSEESYNGIWLQAKSLFERLKSSQFIGGIISPDQWFSWRHTFAIILAGSMMVGAYHGLHWLFPNWLPRFRWRSKSSKSTFSSIDFYNRAVQALDRLGIQRRGHQTQREFFGDAQRKLDAISIAMDGELLSRLYYERRFGGCKKLADADQAAVDVCIRELESHAKIGKPQLTH